MATDRRSFIVKSLAAIAAVPALGRLIQAQPQPQTYAEAVKSLGPVGYYPFDSIGFKPDLVIVKHYNRALSDDEVNENYVAAVGRIRYTGNGTAGNVTDHTKAKPFFFTCSSRIT